VSEERARHDSRWGIERVPGRCGGRPVLNGTRLSPNALLSFHRAGFTLKQIHEQYPSVTVDQIRSALRWAGVRRPNP
jgi:uncharacterized protein (DUF433 family)